MEQPKPKFSADQIKRMLKPMADFAPAFLAGVEILQSFEAAEQGLKDHEKRRDNLLSEIAALEKSKPYQEREAAAARDRVLAINNDIAELDKIAGERKAVLFGLDTELERRRAEIQKKLDADQRVADGKLAVLQTQIEAKQAELKAAEQAFQQWAKEHGLTK